MPMREPNLRKLTLVDAMILIAVTGAGMALVLVFVRNSPELNDSWQPNNYSFWNLAHDRSFFRFMKTSVTWIRVPTLLVAAWAPALLFLRLLHPRPPLRSAFLQPGTVACAATMIVMILNVVEIGIQVAFGHFNGIMDAFLAYSSALQQTAKFAVATIWLILALGGQWRSEPSWIDRMGRIIGIFWIMLFPMSWLAYAFIGNGFE
jgi:hypothetical protein